MKPIDIKDLVNGLITLVLLSIAVGQYGALREFAKSLSDHYPKRVLLLDSLSPASLCRN